VLVGVLVAHANKPVVLSRGTSGFSTMHDLHAGGGDCGWGRNFDRAWLKRTGEVERCAEGRECGCNADCARTGRQQSRRYVDSAGAWLSLPRGFVR